MGGMSWDEIETEGEKMSRISGRQEASWKIT